MKPELKKRAVKLRKEGKTYSEILTEVPVAKSTLSLWLRDVGLSKPQKQRITKKRREAQRRGAKAKREQRIAKTKRIKEKARAEIGELTERELWLIGIALYWAEGTKEKPYRTSVRVEFANSNSHMVALFVEWLTDIVGVAREDVTFWIYIHESSENSIAKVKQHWSGATGFPKESFSDVHYKKHNPKTIRKNTGNNYYGMLAVRINKSTDLNRKISGWVEGISEQVLG